MGWQGKRVSLLYQTAFHVTTKSCPENVNIALVYYIRGGSRGRVQGVCTPPPDLRFSNTTGTLQKKKRTMWFIGVEVDKRRVHPLLKKILDPALYIVQSSCINL